MGRWVDICFAMMSRTRRQYVCCSGIYTSKHTNVRTIVYTTVLVLKGTHHVLLPWWSSRAAEQEIHTPASI